MASKRENKIALAKARRERGIISSQNRILDTIKKEEERMAFNQAMGSNVATAKPLTSAQEGRFYEATGLDNTSNPEEAIKGEVLNTGLSFVQVANALANKAGGGDVVARGAGQVLGRMIPYGTGTMDSNKAIDTYTKWGTGNVTKGDVANVALSGMGIKAATKGVKGLIPAARSVRTSGIPLPVPVSVGGMPIIRVGGKGVKETEVAKKARNTEPYSVALGPEEVNLARSGSPIGIPMEASSEGKGLASAEEYAQLSPEERAIEDSVLSISRQVWGKRRGLNEPPSRYEVQDYPTVDNVREVITKGSKRYGKLSTKQIESLHKSIEEYIDNTPGAKWRIGDRQGLDIHHMEPYAVSGAGDAEKLAPLQSTMNRFIGKKPIGLWYREQINNGTINVWRDIAPELITSIEKVL